MLTRLRSGWADFTRGEKAIVLALSPFALALGFAVGLVGGVLLVTSPLFGA